MNIKYRIDREHIFVTDETGTIRKTPKYEQAEEILVLQNDIEAIEKLLTSKQNEIEDSLEEREDYRTYILITIGSIILAIGSFSLVILKSLSMIGFGSAALFFVTGCLAAKKFDDIKKLIIRNDKFTSEIKFLEEMKKNKTIQMEKLKRSIANKQPNKEETSVPIIERDNETTIEECVQILKMMGEENSIIDLSILYGVMQEIQNEQEQKGKQKVLK